MGLALTSPASIAMIRATTGRDYHVPRHRQQAYSDLRNRGLVANAADYNAQRERGFRPDPRAAGRREEPYREPPPPVAVEPALVEPPVELGPFRPVLNTAHESDPLMAEQAIVRNALTHVSEHGSAFASQVFKEIAGEILSRKVVQSQSMKLLPDSATTTTEWGPHVLTAQVSDGKVGPAGIKLRLVSGARQLEVGIHQVAPGQIEVSAFRDQ